MITGIIESKTLTKHISCECKARLDQRWKNDKSQCKCKVGHVCEKDYVCNPSEYSFENGKQLVSIVDDLVIMCDDIRDAETNDKAKSNDEETKTLPTNFNEIQPEKYSLQNTKFIYFTCLLVDYHCIIVSCQH